MKKNSLVKLLPDSDHFQLTSQSEQYGSVRFHEHGWHSVTPYEDREMTEKVIAEHKITVPFKHIVQKHEGFSVCPNCKARYVGFEQICSRMVPHFRVKGGFWNTWHRGNSGINDRVKVYGNGYELVTETELKPCNSNPSWDLQEQWDLQSRFFEFVKTIGSVDIERLKKMREFEGTLPAGTVDLYRAAIAEQQIQSLQNQVSNAIGGLKMVAEKMNAAGHNLIF